MSAVSKHRQPRLRASCDGCFLAKVKCSKARPICSRCLACGIECRYSPSSRAGKPKADHSNNHSSNSSNIRNPNSSNHHHHTAPIPHDMLAVAAGFSPSYRLNTGWQPAAGMEVAAGHGIARHPSISSELALLAMDENASAPAMAAAAGGAVPWSTPPTDFQFSQFSGSPISGVPMHAAVHADMAVAPSAAASGMSWMDAAVMDVFRGPPQPFSQHVQHVQNVQNVQHARPQPPPPSHSHRQQQVPTPGSIASSSANTYFPSPSTTPSLRQSPAAGHKSASLPGSSSGSGSSGIGGVGYLGNSPVSAVSALSAVSPPCVCFTACLYALQALHNASTPTAPPFDVVLALNRNAVEGCAALLACAHCMRRSGTHTAAMLLATLLGKITSFYKTASPSHFRPNSTTEATAAAAAAAAAATGMGDRHQNNQNHSADAVASFAAGAEDDTTASSVSALPIHADRSSPTSSTAGIPFPATGHGHGHGLGLGLGVSLGAYQLQGQDGRWLELEILNRELKKLEEVYTRFHEVCGDLLFEDVAVSKAMIGYLGQNLGAALELVNHRKDSLPFA
ncbi:transcription factor [Sporothrix brasiliensis 5110]|uniref:Transcription factor n=1 Tax=Sporothrix brasiliensis 5110 TaxID=1398154 RepID=A0A0C2IRJ2_9PEZI|nr:transcription factor [Sporothrix brasiliensis 5110]KIH89510.1 transcription factor [Sporothrix brasiliensis 5110]